MSNDSSSSRDGYDATFWLAYLSNGLTTLANAMLVRYADFVSVLGGEERQLGLIVGAGMIGSIAMRLVQGEAIDRYGAGRIWRWSICLYFFSLLLHLTLDSAYSPAIFVVRIAMQSTLAGMFGSSITFVSLRVPPPRMAEMIGARHLGVHWNLAGALVERLDRQFFGRPTPERRTHVLGRVRVCTRLRHHGVARNARRSSPHSATPPASRTCVATVFPLHAGPGRGGHGRGISIPMSFLRPFAKEYDLGGVGVFFAVYASTAFAARIASRSLFERHGNRPWIILGLALLAISYVAYLPVQRPWQLGFPGAIAGVAHALLFPAIMAAGTSAFPRRYLGVATSFMLAMFDFGTLLGAPLVGSFLRWAKTQGWPDYPAMFSAVAGVLTLVTFSFWTSRAGLVRTAKRAAPIDSGPNDSHCP